MMNIAFLAWITGVASFMAGMFQLSENIMMARVALMTSVVLFLVSLCGCAVKVSREA